MTNKGEVKVHVQNPEQIKFNSDRSAPNRDLPYRRLSGKCDLNCTPTIFFNWQSVLSAAYEILRAAESLVEDLPKSNRQ